MLIEAVNPLPADGVGLSIIGDTAAFPDYVTQLRQLARHPGITFSGRLPRNQLWAALAHIDVVVVPSLWYETAALVIQEAFAARVPVVASRIGALGERVRDGVDGRLVPPGDVAALHDLLHQFWSDSSLLAQLRAGIRPVQTIQEHVRAVESTYAQIAP